MKLFGSFFWERRHSVLPAVVFFGVLVSEALIPVTVNSAATAGPFRRCRPMRIHRLRRCGSCTRCYAARPKTPAREVSVWKPLFDGKSLKDWKSTNFGGEGEVWVKDGQLMLEFGSSLTGVTATRELPKTNYEVRLDAMRVDGIDFFCGMTFPVGDSHCSFIVGGWAGAVVGLSNIDNRDASENETTRYMTFKNNVWYRIRVRVTPERIQTWIDDKKVVDQKITDRKISTRPEMDLSKPFGLAVWETRAAFKNIEMRTLPE